MNLFIGALTWLAFLAHPVQAEFKPLDPLTETKVGHVQRFVAADAFRIGNRIGGRTLSAVGLNFTQHFSGVVEKDVPATSLKRWALLYTTGDKSLIEALGGEEQAVVPFLAYIHQVMDKAEEGQPIQTGGAISPTSAHRSIEDSGRYIGP